MPPLDVELLLQTAVEVPFWKQVVFWAVLFLLLVLITSLLSPELLTRDGLLPTDYFAGQNYPTDQVAFDRVKVATDNDFLKKLSSAGGGRAYRLDDLPGYLTELATQPLDAARPKPRYVPDWRRDQGRGFLTGWLVLFVALIGAEWGVRRWWGLA